MIQTTTTQLQTEDVQIDDLEPPPASPPFLPAVPVDQIESELLESRAHETTAAEDDRLRGSIRRFGILAPIVVSSARNGRYVIVDGHRRYRLARELGLTSLRCVVNPEWDTQTRQGVRFLLESTFKPLTAAEHERLVRRLQSAGVQRS